MSRGDLIMLSEEYARRCDAIDARMAAAAEIIANLVHRIEALERTAAFAPRPKQERPR